MLLLAGATGKYAGVFRTKNKLPSGYDRCCRDLTEDERAQKEKEGITPVLYDWRRLFRDKPLFMTWSGEMLYFKTIWLRNLVLFTKIWRLSDVPPGEYCRRPWYGDHTCHPRRGMDVQYPLPYHAFTMLWDMSVTANLPTCQMLLGSDRFQEAWETATASTSIRAIPVEQGYLPGNDDQLPGFIRLVGWMTKTEIISREDLIKHFSLERVSQDGSYF